MAEYKLHCFAQSGNAYKVALALELAGADWEPAWVDFFKGGTRSPNSPPGTSWPRFRCWNMPGIPSASPV